MLSAAQLDELRARGITRLAGFVDEPTVERMADHVWRVLARRGVDREHRRTWPTGLVSELQPLRQARCFDAFRNGATAGVTDELLGAGRWIDTAAWIPPS